MAGKQASLSPRPRGQPATDDWDLLLPIRKWIINSRGVATIISSPADHVWGTVLLLHDYDKKILDGKEGPRYIQCHLPVDIKGVKRSPRPVLIYIEFNEEFGLPRTEYVGRLKNAMIDGLAKGIPQAYFDKYWLPFLMPSNPGEFAKE
jgi:hypothetical protein